MINNYFIPIYNSNEDDKTCPPEERKLRQRIYHEALKAKFSAGSVCVYILDPDGNVVTSKTVPDTAKVISMLEAAVERCKLKETKNPLKPAPQSIPPYAASDALTLHLVAPYDARAGSWREFPSESWIVLNKPEWSRLLPGDAVPTVGQTWACDEAVAKKLYNYFYPATEDTMGNQIGRNIIDQQELKGTVEAVTGTRVRVKLDGSLKMRRPFYPGHPEHKVPSVDAQMVGYMEYEPGKEINWLKLVTRNAVYGDSKFGVALRSIPKSLFNFESEAEITSWSNLIVPGTQEPPVKLEQSTEHATSGMYSLKLTFAGGKWPGVATKQIPQDWTAFQSFSADVTVSRPCLVGFRVMQEKSTRKEGWDDIISRWEKTELLNPGTTHVASNIHPPNDYSIHSKWGAITSFEIYMYAPHAGESIFVDNIRVSEDKVVDPPASTRFKVLGTDWEVSGVKELAEKLKDNWVKPEEKSVEQVETAFKARFDELKKAHPGAVLAILRDGEAGYDPARPEKVYAGWKDAYFTSHGPDTNTVARAENQGRHGSVEIFMRHRSPLMQADLSSIPKSAKILAAQFVVVRNGAYQKDNNPNQPNMWVAEAVNKPWEEYEVNAYEYAKDKFWTRVGGNYYGPDPDFLPLYLAYGQSGGMVSTWDFTEAVKYWMEHENHGFMLHGDSKDWMNQAQMRESKDVKKRPALMVIYEP